MPMSWPSSRHHKTSKNSPLWSPVCVACLLLGWCVGLCPNKVHYLTKIIEPALLLIINQLLLTSSVPLSRAQPLRVRVPLVSRNDTEASATAPYTMEEHIIVTPIPTHVASIPCPAPSSITSYPTTQWDLPSPSPPPPPTPFCCVCTFWTEWEGSKMT